VIRQILTVAGFELLYRFLALLDHFFEHA